MEPPPETLPLKASLKPQIGDKWKNTLVQTYDPLEFKELFDQAVEKQMQSEKSGSLAGCPSGVGVPKSATMYQESMQTLAEEYV